VNANLVAFVNRTAIRNTFAYDDSQRLLTLTDARGIQTVATAYDGEGRLVSTADAFGTRSTTGTTWTTVARSSRTGSDS